MTRPRNISVSHQRSAQAMTRFEFSQTDLCDLEMPCKVRSGAYVKWELVNLDDADDLPEESITRKQFAVIPEQELPKAFVVRHGRKPVWVCREVGP